MPAMPRAALFALALAPLLNACALPEGEGGTGDPGMAQGFQALMGATSDAFGGALARAFGDRLPDWVDAGSRQQMEQALQVSLSSSFRALLTPEDQVQVAARSAAALDQTEDGETVVYTNPETNTTARITPTATQTQAREVRVAREPQVAAPPPDLRLIGATYQATTDANLRAGPSADTARVGGLEAGRPFTAVGSTENGSWILAARNQRAVGYVAASLVEPATGAAQQAPALRQDDGTEDAAVPDEDDLIVDTVVAQTECRTLEISVESDQGEGTESLTACKAADGAWVL